MRKVKMSLEKQYVVYDKFMVEFRKLVWKHAGKDYQAADKDLLLMMQDGLSVYNPWMWPAKTSAKKQTRKK